MAHVPTPFRRNVAIHSPSDLDTPLSGVADLAAATPRPIVAVTPAFSPRARTSPATPVSSGVDLTPTRARRPGDTPATPLCNPAAIPRLRKRAAIPVGITAAAAVPALAVRQRAVVASTVEVAVVVSMVVAVEVDSTAVAAGVAPMVVADVDNVWRRW